MLINQRMIVSFTDLALSLEQCMQKIRLLTIFKNLLKITEDSCDYQNAVKRVIRPYDNR